jgi:hypothetical protein
MINKKKDLYKQYTGPALFFPITTEYSLYNNGYINNPYCSAKKYLNKISDNNNNNNNTPVKDTITNSTGSLTVLGEISIQKTLHVNNEVNSTGSLTALGGISIQKTLHVNNEVNSTGR